MSVLLSLIVTRGKKSRLKIREAREEEQTEHRYQDSVFSLYCEVTK